VYFVTQSPLDIPDTVLGQLGNRVQHALRAFTPRDQKAVKTAAQTMRANPKLNTEAAILELGVGEALVSTLDEKGTPGMVERAWMLPPGSQIGALAADERRAVIASSIVAGVYEKAVDRESAFERLQGASAAGDANGAARGKSAPSPQNAPDSGNSVGNSGGSFGGLAGVLFGTTGPRGGHHAGVMDAMAKSAARTLGSAVAREIARGLLGSILGGRR
jgi:DNA helicase HerA-like ATPase